ncbi:hypothetical protein BV22DRAFT_1107911 [Leucogyrophana mollusca]|uniref:Uncharacterized protein n=1 Tax=Leucogyrophana mollusca TaxID=85980 RepID=A0ACB8B2Z6_9AGAM|nr:hypothetical protein BV22DRAFT_1107911 [Leucogyrophana mollusca]
MEFTFGGKYRPEEEIAIGGCGASLIKLDPAVPSSRNASLPLKQESKVYRMLVGGLGVPWIMWSDKQSDYNAMVINMLGPSVEDLFKMCHRHPLLKIVLLPTDLLISRLEFIHARDFLRRDVKLANFVTGTEQSAHLVNVIDTGAHIPYRQGDHHGVRTSLFVSLNAHEGIKCSWCDDLKSLAYMLTYFLRGTLPWRKTKGATVSATWDAIHAAKLAALPLLTAGLPAEFAVFFEYARGLEFGDLPDYEGLRELFRGLAGRVGVRYNGVSDWTLGPVRAGTRRFCEACNARREEMDASRREEVGGDVRR